MERKSYITIPATGYQLLTVKTEVKYAFCKTTWQITDRDRLTGTFFNDPYTRDGSTGATTLNNRSVARDQGGDNYKFEYRHDWDNLSIGLYGFRPEAELPDSAADASPPHDVAFLGGRSEQRRVGT